jgi:catechol 2,3-dioxygenase-like lactoylglutathione lyase family enzyme
VLETLDHVVIAVRDLHRAEGRTAALLGRGASWRGAHPGAGTENVLFRVDNTYLELLSPSGGPGAIGKDLVARLDTDGEGLVALAFGTRDIAAWAAGLRERDVAVSEPAAGMGRDDESGAMRRWRNAFLPAAVSRGPLVFAIEHDSPPDALALRPPDPPVEAAVAGLDHVVVASRDLEASRAFYGDTLGLRLALDRSFEKRGIRILFFRVGGVTVEVVAGIDAPAEPEAPDRLTGLAWRVPDADAAREARIARGFDVTEVRAGAKPGTRVCTVRDDTCGVPTLLIQPAPPGAAG